MPVSSDHGKNENGSLRLSPFGGYTVEFERHYDFRIEDVWRTITEPTRLIDWYAEAEIEQRVGGKFEQRFANSGAVAYGVVIEYDPPHNFAHMWVTGQSGSPTQPIPDDLARDDGTCGDLTLAASVIRYALTAGESTRVNLTHYVPLNPELIPATLSKDVAQSASRVSKTPAPDMVLATWDIGLDLLERALTNPGNRTMSLREKTDEHQAAWPWREFQERRKKYAKLSRHAILGTFSGDFFSFD
jgi:uncharacterized protein YndB with AHSA1/START domain